MSEANKQTKKGNKTKPNIKAQNKLESTAPDPA